MDNIIFEKCDRKHLKAAIDLSTKNTIVYGEENVEKIGIARSIIKSDLPYLYIARQGEKIVACMLCVPITKEDIEWYECEGYENIFSLERACVDESFRGLGIIGKLTKYILERFNSSDFYLDTMYYPYKNENCIKAFEKMGFKQLFVKDWFDKKHNLHTKWLIMHYKNY